MVATKTLILKSLQQVTAGDVFATLDADGTRMFAIEDFRRGLGFFKTLNPKPRTPNPEP